MFSFGVTDYSEPVKKGTKFGISKFTILNKSESARRITGRFQELLCLKHPYLTTYIHSTFTSGQMIIVQTMYSLKLKDVQPCDENIKEFTMQLVNGLCYLQDHGIICGNLCLDNVYIENDCIRLSNWGLHYLVGQDVHFPVSNPRYLSPESIVGIDVKRDVWSLGVLLHDWITKRDYSGFEITELFLHLDEMNKVNKEVCSEGLFDFLCLCLEKDYHKRPQIHQLVNHPFLHGTSEPCLWRKRPVLKKQSELGYIPNNEQLFELWKLAGNDLETHKYQTRKPFIFTVPPVVKSTDDVLQQVLDLQGEAPYSDQLTLIDLEDLFERIEGVTSNTELLTRNQKDEWKKQLEWTAQNISAIWKSYETKGVLSLEKESDFSYQNLRFAKFTMLLRKYPQSLEAIQQEALIDIPAIMRGQVWAALLEVKGDPRLDYELFNTGEDNPIDRQLELDIPRCHQYNTLLATPQGHQKLKRILKAWVNAEKGQQVYWQGLDSVCACFLTLNFNNEVEYAYKALAFATMRNFIHKYCNGFFGMDNSKLMRQYPFLIRHMQTLRHLLSFLDAQLSWHLHSIGIGPELYALSWFMTLFAHVFPLDKIYYLWDHFLTGPPFLFMYTAVSILQQLRDQLLASDFTNAMLVFSELSEVSLETCIVDSIQNIKITPLSILDDLRNFKSDLSNGNSASRFSFLSSQTSIVPRITFSDYAVIEQVSIVVDTRNVDAFRTGHIPGSICVIESSFTAPDSISVGFSSLIQRSKYTIVICEDEISEFGDYLIQQKFCRVCLLDATILFDFERLCTCKPSFFGNAWQFKCTAK